MIKRRMTKKKTICLVLLLLLLLVLWAFWPGIVTRTYTIQSNKVNDTITLMLITDLHSHTFGKQQSRLAGKIKKARPQVILLGGDIADDVMPLKGTEDFLAAISGLAPTYYVTGNHEWWSGETDHIKETIQSYGVTVLENEFETINIGGSNLTIAGAEDPFSIQNDVQWASVLQQAFEPLQFDTKNIRLLLSHRPEAVAVYETLSVDMVLSGHAHGGQFRIPGILNGFIAPNQGFFPKYAGGVYTHAEQVHIVSRGLANSIKLPRIFNPGEVVVVKLKPAS